MSDKMREDAIREAARNHAMDEYFNARPPLPRTRHEERLFEAGFDRGMDYLTRLAQAEHEIERLRKDAERYRWLRDPSVYVGKVIDKVAGYEPMTELGTGGYPIYEYRAGPELDEAIDAAIAQEKVE